MHKPEQIRILKGLINHLDNGTTVDAGGQMLNPVSSYTDPEIARNEWQIFFQDHPQMLGLSNDLPVPHSFFTSNELGKPIICTRDENGQFKAFLNVCRHRGAIIEHQARGVKKVFSCPFHAWSYSSSGNLKAIPKQKQFGEVDKSCHNLIALPCQEKYGTLWVASNPKAEPFEVDDLLTAPLAEQMQSWELDKCEYWKDIRFDHAMNWKLANDTFGETYHFDSLHKNTLAMNFHGNCQMYDTFGRNHLNTLSLRNIDKMRLMPEDQWHILKGAIMVYYFFPNIQLVISDEGPTLIKIYPCENDPNNSYSVVHFYSHDTMAKQAMVDTENQSEFTAKERSEAFADIIDKEDYWIAASAHQGALSNAQEYVLFGKNEPALHHYHNTYRAALNQPILPLRPA